MTTASPTPDPALPTVEALRDTDPLVMLSTETVTTTTCGCGRETPTEGCWSVTTYRWRLTGHYLVVASTGRRTVEDDAEDAAQTHERLTRHLRREHTEYLQEEIKASDVWEAAYGLASGDEPMDVDVIDARLWGATVDALRDGGFQVTENWDSGNLRLRLARVACRNLDGADIYACEEAAYRQVMEQMQADPEAFYLDEDAVDDEDDQ